MGEVEPAYPGLSGSSPFLQGGRAADQKLESMSVRAQDSAVITGCNCGCPAGARE